MTPYRKFEVRWKFQLRYHLVLYSVEMKLQCMNFTSANFCKQVNVTKKLGRLGTGIPTAPVWQRAVNRQPGSRSDNS